jgi:hypothetical protein
MVNESLSCLAEMLLIRGEARRALRVLDEVPENAGSPRVLGVLTKALLSVEPRRAPDVLDRLARIADSAERREYAEQARLVRELAKETRVELPGIVDPESAWESRLVPFVTLAGDVGLWGWGLAEQQRGRLPDPIAAKIAAQDSLSFATLVACESESAHTFHCLLLVNDAVHRFTVPVAPADDQVDVDTVPLPSMDVVARLVVLAADAEDRPQRAYVATRSSRLGRHDYEVAFAGDRNSVRQVFGTNAVTEAFLPLSPANDRIVLGLGEWQGFGLLFLESQGGYMARVGLQRMGHVRSLCTVQAPPGSEDWLLVGVSSTWRNAWKARGFPEWPAGVYLMRLSGSWPPVLEAIAEDASLDPGLTWEVAAVADVQVTRDDRVHLAVLNSSANETKLRLL